MATNPETDAPGSSLAIRKGFVDVAGKLVHYVRRGRGPAIVMLHAAPCSARVMASLQEEWGHQFTTFAFDLPGFGLSDMLDAEPLETAHLADAVAGAIRALGLEQVALYGRHTGAGVAVEMAHRHPELCSMVLTDGFPVFATPYSEARIREYMPPIEPVWHGGHLTWVWYRYREQHMFWPWDRPLLAHRAATDVPDTEFLYRGAIEMLESGQNYPRVYASAFRHSGLAMIESVKVPVCYGNRPGDSQFKTVPLYPAGARVKVFSRDASTASAEERAILAERPAAGAVPPWSSRFGQGRAARLRDYIMTRYGVAYVLGAGLNRRETPILLLHDLPGGADLHVEELEALGDIAPVIAPDLFGNGNSVLESSVASTVDVWVDQIIDLLDMLNFGTIRIVAHGTAAAAALAFVRRYPERIARLVLRSPPALEFDSTGEFASNYAPDITPEPDGGNFLRLWHHLRDQELWWPWNKRTLEAARSTVPRIEPAELHRRAVILLKQPERYREIWRATLSNPLLAALAECPCSHAAVVFHEQDIFAFAAQTAAAALASTAHALDTVEGAGAVLRAALEPDQ